VCSLVISMSAGPADVSERSVLSGGVSVMSMKVHMRLWVIDDHLDRVLLYVRACMWPQSVSTVNTLASCMMWDAGNAQSLMHTSSCPLTYGFIDISEAIDSCVASCLTAGAAGWLLTALLFLCPPAVRDYCLKLDRIRTGSR
jgi:hypothetical protein